MEIAGPFVSAGIPHFSLPTMKHSNPGLRPTVIFERSFVSRRLRLCTIVLILACGAFAASLAKKPFNLPAGDAAKTLRSFSEQSGEQIIFPVEQVRGVKTNAVSGQLTAREALDQMLAGTKFSAVEDKTTGALAVQRDNDPKELGAALAKAQSERPEKTASAVITAQTPATPQQDDPITLSPFQVNASTDVGYAARETLSGSRLSTSLRDVSAAVSIMTSEFLSDVGATNLQDALRYSLNVENTQEFYDVTDPNNGALAGNPFLGQSRTRGLGQGSQSHDFFPTDIPIDSYNTERFTFVSGPNAILFSSGNPAGSIDTAFQRANVRKATRTFETRFDSEGSWRYVVNLNQPLWKDKLALRLAEMKQDNRNFRKPNFDRQTRNYATLTASPFKWLTARAFVEGYDMRRMAVRPTVIQERVTVWQAAGSPMFDNRPVANGGQALPANSNLTTANGYSSVFLPHVSTAQVYVTGSTLGTVPLQSWARSVVTRGYNSVGNSSDQTDHAVYSDAVYPLEVNYTGPSLQNKEHARTHGAIIELNPFKNFFIEAGHSRDRFRRQWVDFLKDPLITAALQVDANQYLPDGLTPNPNVGRYYFEENGTSGVGYSDQVTNRLTASYELDFSRQKSMWLQLLGRHRLAGMWFYNRRTGALTSTGGSTITSNAGYTTSWADSPGGSGRGIAFRYYVDNPADRKTNQGVYVVQLPFDPFGPGQLPGTSVSVDTINNPLGTPSTPLASKSIIGSRVFAMQNFLLKDYVVLTYGTRRDNGKNYDQSPTHGASPYLRTGNGANAAYAFYDQQSARPNAWGFIGSRILHTNLKGIVVHFPTKWLKWLSYYHDESNSQNPGAASGKNNLDGSLATPGDGLGKHDGVAIEFIRDRLTLRVTKYTDSIIYGLSTYRAAAGIGGINPFRDTVYLLEKTVLQAGAPMSTQFAAYDNAVIGTGLNVNNATIREQYDVFSNTMSKGFEAELVGNILPQWRVSLGFADNRAFETSIASQWLDFIKERMPIWAQYQNTPLYNTASAQTVGSLIAGNAIGSWNYVREANGRLNPQSRRYRMNLTTRYGFSEGKLRGLFVGGVYQYRSPVAIGYGTKSLDLSRSEFSAPGFNTGSIAVPAIDSPIRGNADIALDGFAGYTRNLWRDRINWRVQLNIRNLLDAQSHIDQQAISTGQIVKYYLHEPRTFILTNTFSF